MSQIFLREASNIIIMPNRVTDALITVARDDWHNDLCKIERATSRWTVTFARSNDYCFDLWQVTPACLGMSISEFTWMAWAQFRVCYALARKLDLQFALEDSVDSPYQNVTDDDVNRVASFRTFVERRMSRYKGRAEMADEFWEELFVGSPPHWQGVPREIHMIKDHTAYEVALAAYVSQREVA